MLLVEMKIKYFKKVKLPLFSAHVVFIKHYCVQNNISLVSVLMRNSFLHGK